MTLTLSPITTIAACLALTISPLLASESSDNIGVLVEYYELEQSALPMMLRAYQSEADATGLLKRVLEMEKQGEAKLIESSYSVSQPGQRNKIESIREYIYPTEYDPPEIPQTLTGPIDPKTVISTPTNPTAFDIRNLGVTLEVDAHFQDEVVSLVIAPELVTFQGIKNWAEGVAMTQQPIFDAAKTQSHLFIKAGGCELFGTFKPAGPSSSKRVLGFISPTRLSPTPKPAPAKPWSQLSLITEYIEVDAALAASFTRELNENIDASLIRLRLDKLVAEGKAQLLETNTILTTKGHRAKSGSVREYIYPTEFDPAEIPQTLTGPIDPDLKMITSAGPTAFDVRKMGLVVELEPNGIRDNIESPLISLRIAPQLVRLVGESTFGTGFNESKQPLFETLKMSTAVVIPDGASVLLGMHSLETSRAGKLASKEEKEAVRNRRVLVFVTAKTKTAE